MKSNNSVWVSALFGAVVFCAVSAASASVIDVSANVPPGSSVTGTLIDSESVQFDISFPFVAGGQAITKVLTVDQAAGRVKLTENLLNTGAPSWGSWEEIVVGFRCQNMGCINKTFLPGVATWETDDPFNAADDPLDPNDNWSLSGASGSFAVAGNAASLSFTTPIAQGDSLSLEKWIAYGPNLHGIAVIEFPTPVPLPASLVLLLSGLAGIAFVGRRGRPATRRVPPRPAA